MRFKIDLALEKWRLVFRVTALNAILVIIAVWIVYLWSGISLSNYRIYNHQYFWPIEQFGQFIREKSFTVIILEEVFYRGPIWILSSSGLVFCLGKYKIHSLLAWLAILIPNYFWAMTHSPAKWPIFIAGISFGWLVYKTKSLWPAMAAHFISNISIYFAIKIASLFIKI